MAAHVPKATLLQKQAFHQHHPPICCAEQPALFVVMRRGKQFAEMRFDKIFTRENICGAVCSWRVMVALCIDTVTVSPNCIATDPKQSYIGVRIGCCCYSRRATTQNVTSAVRTLARSVKGNGEEKQLEGERERDKPHRRAYSKT